MREPKQRKKTLDWLRTNGDLTFKDAVYYLDILDVRKRVQELRAEGYKIITVNKKSPSGAIYGAYRLIEEDDRC